MSLIPQGVSGSSGSGGSLSPSSFTNTAAPGAIYALGRWTGHSLRRLVLGWVGGFAVGRIQIANTYPQRGLHPLGDALPSPQFDLIFQTDQRFPLDLSFDNGLITVLPGETLYLIIYNFVSSASGVSGVWTLNAIWEPIREV